MIASINRIEIENKNKIAEKNNIFEIENKTTNILFA